MLTGNLVVVKTTRDRVIPRFLDPTNAYWLELAESLLAIFREALAQNQTRREIADEVEALIGEGGGAATLVHRGVAKVLEDRAEFEVVSEVPPDTLRSKVFAASAEHRRQLRSQGPRPVFQREVVLDQVAQEVNLGPDQIIQGLFADLKDENRILSFRDMSARALLDRYNVALAQAVLLRSVLVKAEVHPESPARMRQLLRMLKFHRLLFRASGSAGRGYRFQIDGPLSLFSATTRYGLQMALFLPALLQCRAFRLNAELRWGPARTPMSFHLESDAGLVSHLPTHAQYVSDEIRAFLERFKSIAPDWQVHDDAELVALADDELWVPDYRFHHRPTGTDVLAEIVGFWKKSSLERLIRLLPQMAGRRYVLAVSDRLKVDEDSGTIGLPEDHVLRFKDIPNAQEFRALLERQLSTG